VECRSRAIGSTVSYGRWSLPQVEEPPWKPWETETMREGPPVEQEGEGVFAMHQARRGIWCRA
jgi:hypothetical protein